LAAPGRHRKPISGQREREEIENSAYTDYGKDLPGAADPPAKLATVEPPSAAVFGAGQNEQTRESARAK